MKSGVMFGGYIDVKKFNRLKYEKLKRESHVDSNKHFKACSDKKVQLDALTNRINSMKQEQQKIRMELNDKIAEKGAFDDVERDLKYRIYRQEGMIEAAKKRATDTGMKIANLEENIRWRKEQMKTSKVGGLTNAEM